MFEIRHTTGANREVYNDIYAGKGIRQMDSAFIWALDALGCLPGHRLLDVSCGEGQLVHWASRRGLAAYGVDISDQALRVAKNLVAGGKLGQANGEALPFGDGSFDCITSIGSLEHYEDPAQGVREMSRLLRPDGRVLLIVPNTFGLLWNVAYVAKTGDIRDDGQPIQRYGTRLAWQRLLEANGLVVERVSSFTRARPRTAQDLGWYLRRPRKLLSTLFFIPLIPTNLGSSLVYLCRKGRSAQGYP